jgi:hypothetical protein
MSEQHVTVATFPTATEGELVRALLEDEGISVLLLGDLAATTFAGMGSAIGSVHLQVLAEDEPRARRLLAEYSENLRKRKEDVFAPQTEDGQPAWICRTCDEVVAQGVDLCPSCSTPAPASFPLEGAASKPGEGDLDDYQSFDADRLAFRSLMLSLIGLFLPGAAPIPKPNLEPHLDHLSPKGKGYYNASTMITTIGLIAALLLILAMVLFR